MIENPLISDEATLKNAIEFLYINFDFFSEISKSGDHFYNSFLPLKTLISSLKEVATQNEYEPLLKWSNLLKQSPEFRSEVNIVSENFACNGAIEGWYRSKSKSKKNKEDRILRHYQEISLTSDGLYRLDPDELKNNSQNRPESERQNLDDFMKFVSEKTQEDGLIELHRDASFIEVMENEYFYYTNKTKQNFKEFLDAKLGNENSTALQKNYTQYITSLAHCTIQPLCIPYPLEGKYRISVDLDAEKNCYFKQTISLIYVLDSTQIKVPGVFKSQHKIMQDHFEFQHMGITSFLLKDCIDYKANLSKYFKDIEERTTKAANKLKSNINTQTKVTDILNILKEIETPEETQPYMKLKALGDCFNNIYGQGEAYPSCRFFGGIKSEDVEKIGLLKMACCQLIKEGISDGSLDKEMVSGLINRENSCVKALLDFRRKFFTTKTNSREIVENILNPEPQIAEQTFTLSMV